MLNSNSNSFPRHFIKSSYEWMLLIAFTLLGALSLAAQNRFVRVPSYPAGGSLPTLLAQRDVNNDGKLDLIVMNINNATKLETVSLLLGTGTGGYQAPKTMSYYPVSYGKPLAADVNRDGHLDLIFASGRPQITRVYLGQGESFQSTAIITKGASLCDVSSPSCGQPEIQVADFNKDGNPDLLLNSWATVDDYYAISPVYVFLGNGNGTFRAGVATGGAPYTIGDFNNDGLLDLAAVGAILFGNGNGTFRDGPSYSLPSEIYQVGQLVAADLRGNGKTDLILITALTAAQAAAQHSDWGYDTCRRGGVAVLLGNGDGTLNATASSYPTGRWTVGGVVADMNGDHRPDIVVTNQAGGSYSVLLNTGSGKFSPAVNYRSPVSLAGDFVIGDLNGDGRPDLTIASKNGVEILRNGGGGRLLAPQSVDLLKDAVPFSTVSGDLNHDGLPDLSLVGSWYGEFGCHPYDKIGEVQFEITSQKGQPLSSVQDITGQLGLDKYRDLGLGDVNHDGSLDLITLGTDFYGSENYLETLGTDFYIGEGYEYYSSVTVGDFNRDGYADAAVSGDNTLILLGDGTGSYNPVYKDPRGYGRLVSRDISGDGKLDLISTGADVLLGNGDGTFQASKNYSAGTGGRLAIADFNRDGKLDLALAGGSEISIILNNGNGTFRSPVKYPTGGPVTDIAAISLFGNGNQSILVADGKDNKLILLAGDGKGALAAPVNYYPGGGNPSSLLVSDFNGDGALDVVVTDTITSSYMVLYNTGGTSIKLTASNVKPLAGQSVTLTATLAASVAGSGTPSGTVTLKNGSSTLGTVTLSGGKATLSTASLTRGVHTITLVYSGSSTFNSHTSAGLTVTVQ